MDFGDLVRKMREIDPSDISVSRMGVSQPTQVVDIAEPNYITESADIAQGSLRGLGVPSDLNDFLKMAGVAPTNQSAKPVEKTVTPIMEDAYTSINNPPDKVTLDIPLLIRLLEYAREEADDDIIIHDVAERMINLSISGKTLSMDDYSSIIPSKRGRMDKEDRLKAMSKKSDKTEESIAEYLRKAYEAFESKELKRK